MAVKDLQKALKELSVYKEKAHAKMGKYPYHSSGDFAKRLIDVVGEDGYRVSYSEGRVEALPGGHAMMVMKCHIDLLDEQGCVVYSAEGYGGENFEVNTETGNYTFPKNVPYNCQLSAFKSALKQMNVFGELLEDEKEDKGGSKPQSSPAGTSRQQGSSGSPERFVTLYGLEPFKDRNGNENYRLKTCLVRGGSFDPSTEGPEVIFYANQIGGVREEFNNFRRSLEKKVAQGDAFAFTIKGSKGSGGGFIFKGFERG